MKSWIDCPLCSSLNVKPEDVDSGDLCDKHYWQNEVAESDLMVKKLSAENKQLRERIEDLIAGDVMHEPNWSNCNEA